MTFISVGCSIHLNEQHKSLEYVWFYASTKEMEKKNVKENDFLMFSLS